MYLFGTGGEEAEEEEGEKVVVVVEEKEVDEKDRGYRDLGGGKKRRAAPTPMNTP